MNQSTVASSNPAASGAVAPRWLTGLREDYAAIFVEEWSPYLGAVKSVGRSLAQRLKRANNEIRALA